MAVLFLEIYWTNAVCPDDFGPQECLHVACAKGRMATPLSGRWWNKWMGSSSAHQQNNMQTSILIYSKQCITLHVAQKLAKPGGVSDLNGKLLCFERSPPWHYCVIVSDSSSGSIHGIYFLTFYSGILFWHSILAFFSGILSGIYSDILFGILSGINSDTFSLGFCLAFFLIIYLSGIYSEILPGISSGTLSGILPDSLFWHSIWHLFWHAVLPCYLTFFLAYDYVSGTSSDIPSGILSGIYSEILCGWGPAGNTLIRSFDPELAVEVRRETLWSWGCCSGPVGTTAI